jgi:hypothetical protein
MNYEVNEDIFIGRGNIKIGKIKNFSLPVETSCPGKSLWCKSCYAKRYEKRFKRCQNAYQRNLNYSEKSFFSELLISQLEKKSGCNVRIHPSGDFYSIEYIDQWINICKKMVNHNFWCYTRSWNVPELFPKIKELSKIKNIQVILSTDPTMELPPKDFRIAFVEEDIRANGIICLHDTGLKHSCLECGYCFKNKKGNVIFKNKMKKRIK